jgi:transcriptional regulator with XRE-family HTH domain
MKLGSIFKKVRKNKGYTQKYVTNGILTQGAYSKFEQNMTEISATSYFKS